MNRFYRLLLPAIAAAWIGSAPTAAQDVAAPVPGAEHAPGDSISYSNWAIEDKVVRLQVSLPVTEAEKMAGPNEAVPDASAVSDAVAASFAARSAGGPCSVVDQGEGEGEIYRLALTPGLYKFEMIFLCPSTSGITISDHLLFDRVPRHINFARIQAGSARAIVKMFNSDHRTFSVAEADGASNIGAFARAGALNLVRHADLLCMLAAISLFCGSRLDLLVVTGGIVIGQAITAGLAVAGFVLERPSLVGAAAGLLVAGLGAAALRFRNADRPPATRGWRIVAAFSVGLGVTGAVFFAARLGVSPGFAIAGVCVLCLAMLWGAQSEARPHWLAGFPAVLLGLLSGMSIATNLAFLSLPPANSLPPMAGWMVGVTGAAVLFASLVRLAFFLLGRRSPERQQLASEAVSAALIGLGFFWFVGRL